MEQLRNGETQLTRDVYVEDRDLRGLAFECLGSLLQIEYRSHLAPKLLLEQISGGDIDEVVILQQKDLYSSKGAQWKVRFRGCDAAERELSSGLPAVTKPAARGMNYAASEEAAAVVHRLTCGRTFQ
jgi:hypothetical protein